MYIHIGQDVLVQSSTVIGVFDMDNTTSSRITRDFLKQAELNKMVVTAVDELPKSFVVCSDATGIKVYLSQLSPQTLLKRSEI